MFYSIAFSFLYLLLQAPMHAQDQEAFGTTDRIPIGFTGKVYKLPDSTTVLPDLDKMKPIVHIYTKELNVPNRNFKEGFPGVPNLTTWFAVQYEGHFTPQKEGVYDFRLVSDDGSKLFIDGALVINHDGLHMNYSARGKMLLTVRSHYIKVQYFQGPPNDVALQLFGNLEGEKEVIFPGEYFALSPPGGPKKNLKPLLALLIPALISMALNFVPVVGTYKGFVEGVTGRDIVTGEEQSTLQRVLGIVPGIGGMMKFGLGRYVDSMNEATRLAAMAEKEMLQVSKITGAEKNIAQAVKPVTLVNPIIGKTTQEIANEAKTIEKITGETKTVAKSVETVVDELGKGIKASDNITDELSAVAKKTTEVKDGIKNAVKNDRDVLNDLKPELENAITEFRKKTGIAREPKILNKETRGGIVAAVKPKIKGFPEEIFTEGSARAKVPYEKNKKLRMPKEKRQELLNHNRRYQSPNSFLRTRDHAEQNSLGNLADELDKTFKNREDVKGTVFMQVEKKVCQTCLIGIENPDLSPGILKQFTSEFPNLKLVVGNMENTDVLIIQNGVFLQ